MLQARVTFSRSQIRCYMYVTIYAICCATTSNKTRVSPKHKARVNANMRLVKPMNNPLGVSPSKGNQGTTRGKEKIF